MTTREENLKKINDELEKLSDDELEQIAGGAPRRMFEQNQNNSSQNNYSIQNRLFAVNFLP